MVKEEINKGYMIIRKDGKLLYNGLNIIRAISHLYVGSSNGLYPINGVYDAALKSIIALQSRLN